MDGGGPGLLGHGLFAVEVVLPIVTNPTSDIQDSFANAASNATEDGAKSVRRTKASASGAPQSRSMPESSHSIERGPLYPIRLSARNSDSKSTSPWPGETKSQPRPGSPKFRWPPRIEERPSSRRTESL